MLISAGPITMARPGWGLKENTITAVVSNGSDGYPEVLCAQMLIGAAASGVRVLALLPGLRTDEPTWAAIGRMLGGGEPRSVARELRSMPLITYASGTGHEHVGKAGLVYAPGLRSDELERLLGNTSAPVLTLTDLDSETALRRAGEVLRVDGDRIVIDSEGFEVSVTYDPDGPLYRVAE
jgi:hypothetical protein